MVSAGAEEDARVRTESLPDEAVALVVLVHPVDVAARLALITGRSGTTARARPDRTGPADVAARPDLGGAMHRPMPPKIDARPTANMAVARRACVWWRLARRLDSILWTAFL